MAQFKIGEEVHVDMASTGCVSHINGSVAEDNKDGSYVVVCYSSGRRFIVDESQMVPYSLYEQTLENDSFKSTPAANTGSNYYSSLYGTWAGSSNRRRDFTVPVYNNETAGAYLRQSAGSSETLSELFRRFASQMNSSRTETAEVDTAQAEVRAIANMATPSERREDVRDITAAVDRVLDNAVGQPNTEATRTRLSASLSSAAREIRSRWLGSNVAIPTGHWEQRQDGFHWILDVPTEELAEVTDAAETAAP